MPNRSLLEQIDIWHGAHENGEICDAILAVPEQGRTNELMCLLARALNNDGDFAAALDILDSIKDDYADDPYFCVRYGFALYELHREDAALFWFEKAQEKGLEELNETPAQYHPQTVSKWIMFARRRAPQRMEKNKFELLRRNDRLKLPQYYDFKDVNFDGFWADDEFSTENYIGKSPSDAEIAQIESELGYILPNSYKALIKIQNGGCVQNKAFKNPLQRDWAQGYFNIDSIFGIDREKSYSLCGDKGNEFWISEWGYPNIGVAICDCPSAGHDMIFLDYSDCGPKGEPCVVHINQESNYEITYLADNFADFVKGLVDINEDDE